MLSLRQYNKIYDLVKKASDICAEGNHPIDLTVAGIISNALVEIREAKREAAMLYVMGLSQKDPHVESATRDPAE